MRVGDARRIHPEHVHFEKRDKGTQIRLTIVQGKSVRWTGPYTVYDEVTEEIGKRIRERTRIALSLGAATLFSEEAQRALSSAVAGMRGEGLGDYSLRSIRKGRLQYLSAMGASTPELLALTQHRSLATLRRYLGWGVEDKEAARLASERATKVRLAVEASRTEGGGCDTRHPMKMGSYSGKAGNSGRRIAKAPELFPTRAPSREELGLPAKRMISSSMDTPAKLPLHLKNVQPINLAHLREITQGDLAEQLDIAMLWLSNESLLGVNWAPPSRQRNCHPCTSQLKKSRKWSVLANWNRSAAPLSAHARASGTRKRRKCACVQCSSRSLTDPCSETSCR